MWHYICVAEHHTVNTRILVSRNMRNVATIRQNVLPALLWIKRTPTPTDPHPRNTHIHVHAHTHTQTQTCICLCTHMYAHMHTHIQTYPQMHTHSHACTHTNTVMCNASFLLLMSCFCPAWYGVEWQGSKWIQNWKGCGRKCSCKIPVFPKKNWWKSTGKSSNRTVGCVDWDLKRAPPRYASPSVSVV